MAIPYVEMRCNLWTNPKVRRMAKDTGHRVAAIIGGLHWFWSQVHEHGEGDDVAGLSAQDVDKFTKLRGFADALSSVGWGVFSQNRASAPRFSENSAANAKERERVYNATRKKKWRSKAGECGFVPDSPGDSPKMSPTPVSKLSKAERSKAEQSEDQPPAIAGRPPRLWEDTFGKAWAESHGGSVYPWSGAKDGQAMGRIRKHFGEDIEAFRPVLARYLADDEDFVVKQGHTVAFLNSRLASYLAEKPTRHAGSNGTVFQPREDFDGCLPGETTVQAMKRRGQI